MSLFKQLWLSIAFLMGLAFMGSFVASSISAKAYLEEQLFQKNVDNAYALALTLSSKMDDSTMIELFINSQFDTGHYKLINLVDVEGNTIVSKTDERDFYEAPDWLVTWFSINVKPGVAQVSDGWRQIGTLSLSSHTRFAHRQLWQNAKNLFYYFVLMSLASGVLGSALLRWLVKPLHQAVDHARAVGERRFITTEVPKTLEFKALIQSMNKLSSHVKKMLEAESEKLERWRQDMQHDEVSGLLNRGPTFKHLTSFLSMENEISGGTIVLLRILDLFTLNQEVGRKPIDNLLRRIGETLSAEGQRLSPGLGVVGRLNGSDFMVILPSVTESAEGIGEEIFDNMNRVCRQSGLDLVKILASSTMYHHGDNMSSLMSKMDSALASAAEKDTRSYIYANADAPIAFSIDTDDWSNFLTSAIEDKRFLLEQYPVHSHDNALLFISSSLRLVQQDGSLLNSGVFMPHVSRLHLGEELNLLAIELAIGQAEETDKPICITLSANVLSGLDTMVKIAKVISSHMGIASKLWIEIPEYGVFQNIEGYRNFCNLLKPLNCKVGISHVRKEALHIGELHDLGIDYVKIDKSLVHGIDETTSYQIFLRGLCTIVHSIGLVVVASGITNETEWKALQDLGIDGGGGPYFTK